LLQWFGVALALVSVLLINQRRALWAGELERAR